MTMMKKRRLKKDQQRKSAVSSFVPISFKLYLFLDIFASVLSETAQINF